MERESIHGLMDLIMKEIGRMINHKAKANYFMLAEIFMKEIGRMIWLTEKGSIIEREDQNIMEIGKMIYKMGKVLKFGQMVQNMKESILMAK